MTALARAPEGGHLIDFQAGLRPSGQYRWFTVEVWDERITDWSMRFSVTNYRVARSHYEAQQGGVWRIVSHHEMTRSALVDPHPEGLAGLLHLWEERCKLFWR